MSKKSERIDEIMNNICGVCDFLHSMGEDKENIEIIEKSTAELAKIALGEITFPDE